MDDLQSYEPLLASWFRRHIGDPTDVQRQAWASIDTGLHTLIASPTGSGKTLAALLPCMDRLLRGSESGEKADALSAEPGVRLLYVTPLKALNNDIGDHLETFFTQMASTAEACGFAKPNLRYGVRTGDTPSSTRASMLRKPPDILVTTPESLYLILSSDKGRQMLRHVEQVIVDEIHDLIADKRGMHLSLSLERLEDWCGKPVQRIGVSATQKPLERVAQYLGGWESPGVLRPVNIVESGVDKLIDVRVMSPKVFAISADKESAWMPIVEAVLELLEGVRTALVFVNNRRLCERLALRLNDHVGYEIARSHHGSVAREKRLEVEKMLKSGRLKCLVATSSLELGIDVGHVDLVVQVDSPKHAAAGIQRIGRAGHRIGETSRGVVLSKNRGELAEIAVLSRMIAARDIDEIRVPRHSLDVLSQQVTAMVAADDWPVEALYELVVRSDSYCDYPRERLEAMLRVLAGYYPYSGPVLEWDRAAGVLRRRSNTHMAAIMGAGTIPQSTGYPVYHRDSRIHLGELDEEYIAESRSGDVFQLGASSWMVHSIQTDRVLVTESDNRFSEIPFWKGEANGRSFKLGARIGAFVAEVGRRIDSGVSDETLIEWLGAEYFLDGAAAEQLLRVVREQKRHSALPTDRTIVIERFVDETSQTHLVIHSLFGKTFNRTWMLALRRQFEQTLPYRFYSYAKDDGFAFISPEWDESWMQSFWRVDGRSLEGLLVEALPSSPMFGVVFRHLAETSLLLSRGYKRMPIWLKRLKAEELLNRSLPYKEEFPLISETFRECLYERLDAANVKTALDAIEQGEMRVVTVSGQAPSAFARQIIADWVGEKLYESDELRSDIQFQLLAVDKKFAEELFGVEAVRAAIDPEVLEAERGRLENNEGADTVASAADVYRLLKQRGDLTENEIARLVGGGSFIAPSYGLLLNELERAGQVELVDVGEERRYICRDERETYADLAVSRTAQHFVVGRYVENRLSFTEEDVVARYSLPPEHLGSLIARWQEERFIEPAPFAESDQEGLWTCRSVASRLIRFSLHKHRRSIEAVDPEIWCRHLLDLHRVGAGSGLAGGTASSHRPANSSLPIGTQSGPDVLRDIIAQLQGLFLPLSHWESIVFPARLASYRKEDLDGLCASGEIIWIGKKEKADGGSGKGAKSGKSNSDNKEGKIAFFLAESKELYAPFLRGNPGDTNPVQRAVPASDLRGSADGADVSRVARVSDSERLADTAHLELLELLQRKGAVFLTALSRETGELPSKLMDKLMDLVWEGRVSNDQFAPLRLHGTKSKTKSEKFQSGLGRWYALDSLADEPIDPEKSAVGWARQLLQRNGVVTKAAVSSDVPFSWDTLRSIFDRLEEWGAATKGLFVKDVLSIQYGTRETVSALRRKAVELEERESRSVSSSDVGNPTNTANIALVSAVDPANPFGALIDWPERPGVSFARKPGNVLVFVDGKWTLWLENNGKRIYSMRDGDEFDGRLLKSIIPSLIRRLGLRKLVIDTWNGSPATTTGIADQLEGLGAERDRSSYVFWPSSVI